MAAAREMAIIVVHESVGMQCTGLEGDVRKK